MKSILVGDIKMPITDFVVARTAILGITKSGKTYAAKGIAEQLLDANIPIIVFDAIGVWRFLRTPGAGPKGQGYKIVVAGGKQPDLPLTPASAPAIVRAAIHENIPLIIDLYDPHLSKADWRRIVQESFRILLYENKGLRHVFLEESAEFAPQKIIDGQTYAEVEKLARMGGNASVGITFINQRAQELNKAVLELCDNLILLRQRGSHAIEALEKWLDRVSPDVSSEITKSLPHMSQGDCWVWTESSERPVRTRTLAVRSLLPDRRNPEQSVVSSKSVDTAEFVAKLSGELGKIIEETKESDPAALKRKIADLKQKVQKLEQQTARPAPAPVVHTETKTVEIPVMSPANEALLDQIVTWMKEVNLSMGTAKELMRQLPSLRQDILNKIVIARQMPRTIPSPPPPASKQRMRPIPPPVCKPVSQTVTVDINPEDMKPNKCERAILRALVQYPQGRSAIQLAVLTGYSINSGSFKNALGRLRTYQLITRTHPIEVTEIGSTALGNDWEPLPTGQELVKYWLDQLSKCEKAILNSLLAVYPEGLTPDQLGEQTGYSPNSGSFKNSLGRMRTLELVQRGQPIKASEHFFQ